MSRSLFQSFKQTAAGLSRRDLFKSGSLLALPALLLGKRVGAAPPEVAAPAAAAPTMLGALEIGPNIYKSIGVRPFINCTGTLTVNGGSLELPAIQAAQAEASRHMVQLDELMHAVGARLGELTGAEFGIVASGCAAAITHATSACLAGGNPEKHIHLPSMDGMDKSEVIIPKAARNNYDSASRGTGVKIVEPRSAEELEAAINPKTAMIYIRSEVPNGPPTNTETYRIAKAHNIPVLVDAAPEILTIPNVHLQAGATMVVYSGGKQLRGPQCAGLLIGRKDLVRAAWVHSAPHHGFSRSMKVGKEEVIGMLAAVEAWVAGSYTYPVRWQEMIDRMNAIKARVETVPGVTGAVRIPADTVLSNRSPSITVSWDPTKNGITGQEVARLVDTTEPRILLSGGGGAGGGGRGGRGAAAPAPAGAAPTTSVSITAFNMGPGEDKIVADRLHDILSAQHTPAPVVAAKPPAGDLTGDWDVTIQYEASTGTHLLTITQEGATVSGTHKGEFLTRPLNGTVNGNAVTLRSNVPETQIGNALSYNFIGTFQNGQMSGDLDMGEYMKATWTAKKHG
jgi:D-glucosaminate-6-phosphate ammonia-lyase